MSALVAIALAYIGIWGVLKYQVRQGTHEFGIRVALSAKRKELLCLVFSGVRMLVFIGIVGWVSAAYFLSQLVEYAYYQCNR